ncbi:MAG TPA: TIM barrel protein [Candidatus Paceibacterota bacterium]|nr:TIM barrel protein [Candidatus Paceibacterota bacterium]
MAIRFGPGGLGPVKEAVRNLEEYNKLGLKACEIEFTYGVYIKPSQAPVIRERAKELDIKLSIHAHYWINLNSEEKEKVEQSKKRIIECCKIGDLLSYGNEVSIVFHPGFYGKKDKEESYENIKKEVLELQEEIERNKWKVKLCPETTGKVNVFGSVEEILKLVHDTNCGFTIDFAHLLARSNGKLSYKEAYKDFKDLKVKELHCHFSSIAYGEKGEKNHILTSEKEIEKLLEVLKGSGKEITIINESPDPVGDSVKSLKIWNKLN